VLSNGDTIPHALGLAHGNHRGVPLVGHNGGFMGYRSDFVRFPTQRLTIVTLCNTSAANPTLIARQIASLLLEGRVPLGPEPPAPSPVRPPAAATIALSAEELASYAGKYFSTELNATYELVPQDGRLIAARGPMQRLRAVPIARDRFRAETGPTFQFVRDGGRITGFSLTTFPARNIRFVRQN